MEGDRVGRNDESREREGGGGGGGGEFIEPQLPSVVSS